MNYRQLYIFVEGSDDIRFFQKMKELLFTKKYNYIEFISYKKGKKIKECCSYLESIKHMNKGDLISHYIFITDNDEEPCLYKKRKEIKEALKNVDLDRVIVVIEEIESWYIAGIDNNFAQKYRINCPKNTNKITKEKFNDLIPKKLYPKENFMIEILKNFSMENAIKRNSSFLYFKNKFENKYDR